MLCDFAHINPRHRINRCNTAPLNDKTDNVIKTYCSRRGEGK
ncbi:hypothetical protein HMPREF0201_01303 [Cedecea davisae DSM 4568]|uniref:Uncharacterized protein n=1 Tax=Cedecea davisae DSM 4568 TaxID=566551 RepID=S3IYC2_9ENTR|nr:hypothetical protein HMPREF0201_01303 [Cedecea davisae DSM 4568]